MEVKIKNLGLAAYLKCRGETLKRYDVELRAFVFDSTKNEDEWMVQYYNSCCSAHDAEVCNLRKFINKSKEIS
jgi:hypothetical protein